MSEGSIGFLGSTSGKEQKAIKNMFSPEFRNRLDAIISFLPLAPDIVEKVVDKMIGELQAQLADKKVIITLAPAARKWLATSGYDPGFGARPLRRLIMKEIGDRLTEEILFGSLSRGGEVKIGFRQGELNFRFPEEAVAR